MGALEFRGSDFTAIVELTPALRRRIEQTIDHLVSILDAADGDSELEPNLAGYQSYVAFYGEGACDLELDDADDEDGGDDEAEEFTERDGLGRCVNVFGNLVASK